MTKKDESQNIEIATIKQDLKDLRRTFDTFITNEFQHLRDRVDWVLWVFILGTLVSITINIFFSK